MSEWNELEIGNLCEVLSSKRIFASDYVEEGVPFYRSKEIIEKALGQFSGNELFISKERFNKIKTRFGAPKKGDLLISAVGNRSGIPYCVKEEFDFYFKDGNLIWFKNFDNNLNSKYLEYYLSSKIGQNKIESVMIGSAQKALTISGIKGLKITIPPIQEQKAIAHILGKLDDKIELNRQKNQTLEAMAQAFFKSWFVDFDPVIDNAIQADPDSYRENIPEELQAKAKKRKGLSDSKKLLSTNPSLAAQFPDSFVFNETLGKWIPEGWEDVEVGDILERLKISNRYKKDQVKEFGKVPVYEQGADILLGYHENKPDVDASINHPAFIFGDHTCVMKLGISPFSISANVIVLKGNARNTIWTYFGLQGVQSFEEYRRHWMELIVKSIILPPVDLCDKFQELIKPYILQKFETQKQIETLTQLRNTLLPELISGRVRVKEHFSN